MADPHAEPEPPRHPARKWVVATVVMAAAVIGLGIWAFTLRSDVEDKDAQIAAQQQQIEEQGDVAGQVREAAGGFTEDVEQKFAALQDQLEQVQGAADTTQEQTQAAIEQAEQAATEASDRVAAAEGQAERARAEADEVTAQAEAAGACVRGYLSSIAGIFDADSVSAGVDAATAEFEALNASCADALGSG